MLPPGLQGLRLDVKSILWVAAGGACGAVLRFAIQGDCEHRELVSLGDVPGKRHGFACRWDTSRTVRGRAVVRGHRAGAPSGGPTGRIHNLLGVFGGDPADVRAGALWVRGGLCGRQRCRLPRGRLRRLPPRGGVAVIDPQTLRRDVRGVADRLRRRGFDLDVARFEGLEARRRSAQDETERLRHERRTSSKRIGGGESRRREHRTAGARRRRLGGPFDRGLPGVRRGPRATRRVHVGDPQPAPRHGSRRDRRHRQRGTSFLGRTHRVQLRTAGSRPTGGRVP